MNIDNKIKKASVVSMNIEQNPNKKRKRNSNISNNEKKKINMVNRLRDGVYCPPQTVYNLEAKSCVHWIYNNPMDKSKTCEILMKQSDDKDVYFVCSCTNRDTNNIHSTYCKHITSVLLRLGLNQIKQIGKEETIDNVLDMLCNFKI